MKQLICGLVILSIAVGTLACSKTTTVYQRVVDPSPWWGYRNYQYDHKTDDPPAGTDSPPAESLPSEPDIGAPVDVVFD
jgi:hypothetical protein